MLRVVVSDDFGIQVGNDHMCSTSLSQSSVCTIATDGIITVDNALAIFIKSCYQVEGIIGEESSSVEGLGDQMSNGVSGGCSFDFVVINFELSLEDLT